MADNDNVLRASLDTSGFTQGALTINIAIENIQKGLQQTSQATAETERTFSSLSATAAALASVMGAVIGSYSIDKLIEVNSTYNRLSVEMNTVTGSAKGAQEAIQSLIQFANTTPYTLDQVSEAFIRLRNAGLDSSTTMLSSLSNVASSIGRPIGDITEAIASAAVGNTEMLKGFGIEAQQAGDRITMTFQGISTTIDRSGPAIEKYIAMLGNTTFEGDTERQAQTIAGRMSTLQDSVENVLRAVGDGGFNDAFKGIISDLTDANNHAETLGHTVGSVLGAGINEVRTVWHDFGTEIDAVGVGLATVVATGGALRATSLILGGLSSVISPIPLTIAGITTAILLFKDKTVELGGQPTTVMQGLKDGWAGLSTEIGKAVDGVEKWYQSSSKKPTDPANESYLGTAWRKFNEFDDTLTNNVVGAIAHPVDWWNNARGARQRVASGGSFMGNQQFSYVPGFVDDLVREGAEAETDTSFSTSDFGPLAGASVQSYPRAMSDLIPGSDNALRGGLLSSQSRDYLSKNPQIYQAMVDAANRNRIPVSFFMKTLETESGPFSDASATVRSPTGAIGFGQVLQSTARDPGFIPAFTGDLTNPVDNINFSADYLAARARKEQGTDNPDWIKALGFGSINGGYGTLSSDGSLGNIQHMIESRQKLVSALKFDQPEYQDLGINANAQATAQIANLQMTVGTQSDYSPGYGQRRALGQALIQAGFGINEDENNPNSPMRGMTWQEALQRGQSQNWQPSQYAAYQRITQLAPLAYTSGQDHQLDTQQQLLDYDKSAQAIIAVSKARELDTVAERARIEGIQAGLSQQEAARKGDLARVEAMNQLGTAAARAAQQSRMTTEQTTGTNSLIRNQTARWDETTNSYILDTRDVDAQRLIDQNDPYNVRPDTHEAFRQQANAAWDTQRAQADAQQRLKEISQSDPMAGLKSGWADFRDSFSDINSDMKKTFTDSLSGMNSALTQFVVTGKGGWSSLAQSVESDITSMSIHYLESAIFKYAGNAFSSLIGLGGGGTSFDSVASGPSTFAKGGVFTSGLSGYSGSIVSSPTYFSGEQGARYASGASLMGEAGPEAIIPLKRGADGNLGIASSGGSGAGGGMSFGDININNPTVTDGKMDEKTMSAITRQISDAVDIRLASNIGTMQRPGGSLYGLRR